MKLGIQLRFISFVVLISLSFASRAQIVSYGNEYLKIGSSARGTAMGNAVASLSSGAEALYFNPANITKLTNTFDITATHSEYFGDMANYDFVSIAFRNDTNSAIALGFVRFGVDNIPNTLYIYNNGTFDLNAIQYFSVSDNAVFLGYSRRYTDKLNIGGTLKIIYRHQGQFANAYGFGLDLGASYKYKDWILSAIARDALGTYTAWFFSTDSVMASVFAQTGNDLPHNKIEVTLPWLTLSLAREFTIKSLYHIRTELDLVNYFEGRGSGIINTPLFNSSPQIGLEADYKKIIFIRMGAYNFQRLPYYRNGTYSTKINFFPSLGIGLKYKTVELDYSFGNFYNPGFGLSTHFFSIRIEPKHVKLPKFLDAKVF